MAANIWKLTDVYGRVYYYETEERFKKRHMAVAVEAHFTKRYHQQHNSNASWLREVKGYRVVNDEWQEQPVDQEAFHKAVEKREIKELQRSMKHR